MYVSQTGTAINKTLILGRDRVDPGVKMQGPPHRAVGYLNPWVTAQAEPARGGVAWESEEGPSEGHGDTYPGLRHRQAGGRCPRQLLAAIQTLPKGSRERKL